MTHYLHNTRLRIEKFVYEKGTNVALYHAEHSKEYQAIQKDIKRGLMNQIDSIANYKDVLPLLVSMAKSVTGGPLFDQVSVLLAKVPLNDDVDFAAYLVWAGSQGGQAAMDKLGISGIFGLKNDALITYFNDYSRLVINSVDNYTKQWIATKIQDGKIAGLTPFEIQQSLMEDGEAMSAIRAERIVLTETAQAMKVIENEAARRYGITEMIWRTSRDERVCPICLPLEGKIKPMGKTYPDGFDGPPGHVSCRCYEEEVIPTDWVIPEKIWLGE